MKIPINTPAMKNILPVIFLIHSIPTIAQPSVSPSILQHIEVSKATTDVCKIDPDSRQCERMQSLMVKNSPVASQGNFLGLDPKAPPGMLEYLFYKSEEKQSLINSMELSGKMQASRMYRVLNIAKDKICDVKQESLPCMNVLMSFVYQAEVETGEKLNIPATIPADIKQSVRKLIDKEHPELMPSARFLLEANIFSRMQEDNEAALSSIPAPALKEKERKGRGICADKYSPSYDPQKCR